MSRHRILLVEPNRELGRVLQEYLRRSDLDVLAAFDAASALEIARRERPDLIVSEAELPGGASGLELSRALTTENDLVSVPLLLLSGAATPEERLDSLTSGAEDYLLKPFTM